MNEMQKCVMRRQILSALNAVFPMVCTASEIIGHPYFSQLCITAEQVEAELRILANKGYLRDCLDEFPSFGSCYKITYNGIQQLKKQPSMDPLIWGTMAI